VRRQGAHLLIALAWVSIATAQSVPAQLAEVAAKAGLDRPVTAWCSGASFEPAGRARSPSPSLPLRPAAATSFSESDAIIHELGPFTRRPDLSCYTRAEADRLNVTIGPLRHHSRAARATLEHRGDLRLRGRHSGRVLAVFA
jgi:hypothetical protein